MCLRVPLTMGEGGLYVPQDLLSPWEKGGSMRHRVHLT